MKTNLTDRQQEILLFIQQFRDEMGYPPTLREIGKKFDISSTFGVKRHLDALEKKGFLSVESFASRGISIKNENSTTPDIRTNAVPVNIIGRVAAGVPVTAIENVEGTILLDPTFLRSEGEYFGLKVKGESMINAGIFDGDVVIVDNSAQIMHNDIVVALIDGEATVKRLYKKANILKLMPENENYLPIDLTFSENYSIIGQVTGVFRWLNNRRIK